MSRWMDPLLASLEQAAAPVTWFFRDDDAGWADRRLLAVADVFGRSGVVLDIAAIPAALSPSLSAALRGLAASAAVSVHQHGWAHVSHQSAGRRSEFGTARSSARQLYDLQTGQRVLCELLEGAVEPFFTPPWNRCEYGTVWLLGEVGLAVLSADVSAPRREVPGITEIPVGIDWARYWREGGAERLGAELARAVRERAAPAGAARPGMTLPGQRPEGRCRQPWHAAPALGVMLHHATMPGDQRRVLARLLATLSAHPSAVLAPMRSVWALRRQGAARVRHTIGGTGGESS